MTDKTIDLDHHRGMAAQKATDLRRLLADVEANERALRARQDELESHRVAAPAANWHEAAEKARYLLNLFANTLGAQDPRRQKLILAVLEDFERLARESQGAENCRICSLPFVGIQAGSDAEKIRPNVGILRAQGRNNVRQPV
jgi:hypothetical protein